MVVRGRIRNGVVVLSEGIRLAEGQEVLVVPQSPVEGSNSHGILDIPVIHLGSELMPGDHPDLLHEMLEGRR